MTPRRSVVNIPNALSGFRLLAAPVLVGLVLADARTAFVGLLIASLATDALDGLAARLFDQRTQFGARLDSVADLCTYGAALVGVLGFEYAALAPHIAWLYAFLGLYLLSILLPVVKFGRFGAYHLYSSKLTAAAQTAALLVLFLWGFDYALYVAAMAIGIFACFEDIAVTLAIAAPVSNARSLYFVLRDRR